MSPLTTWTVPAAFVPALFWIAVGLCAVAQVFILRAVFRALPAPPVSSSVPAPKRWPEILWAVLPVFGLAAAFYGAWLALP